MGTEDKPRKTAQQKAQEAVDLAQRRVDGIAKRKAAAEAQVETLTADLAVANATLTYVKSHPALTQETAPAAPAAEVAAEENAQTALGDF